MSDTATFTVVVREVVIEPPTIQMPSVGEGGEFVVRLTTVAGRIYFLEYKDAWTDPESQRADEVLGDGTPRLLSDPAPEPPTRFYRVGVVPGS